MLIPSPRHTRADLSVWAEQEKADRSHSHSRMLGRNIRRCEEYVREFLATGPAWVAVSWGKDSVVLADMVLSIAPRTPLCWVRVEPIVNPDCSAVRDAFLRGRNCEYHEVEVHCRRDADGVHASGTLEAGSQQARELLGERTFLGLRASESTHRMLRVVRHGVNCETTSAPLAHLSPVDIFAILHQRGLPVHPAYAMNGGGRWPREFLRVASLTGKRGNGHGREQWEREYYGDVLNRLAQAD